MRRDSIGMFWEDTTGLTGRPRPKPPIPDTGWVPPASFPRLERATAIGVDLETKDEGITSGMGPGDAWHGGFIAGISVAVPEGDSWYFPMRHEGGGNMDPNLVLRWANDELTRASQPKVGANLLYDYGWLLSEGVDMRGPLYDVQFAEPLLDEHAFTYALERLAQDYLGEGKEDALLYEWLAAAFGGSATRRDQAKNIWRAPVQLAGPYAESDASLPLRVLEQQVPQLKEQGLYDVFLMECQFIPMLTKMRHRGVKVDVEGAERVRDEMIAAQALLQKQLDGWAGRACSVGSGDDIAKAFDAHGLTYPTTDAGNPSFRKEWLQAQGHPLPQLVSDIRRLDKSRGTFVESYILEGHINGRVHAQFHPLRTDHNGTISGRFSSSNPNLQNAPSRDPEMRQKVRGLFLPDRGRWRRYDYSQIEYRLLAHYARGPGSDEIRQAYRDDPHIDYHEKTRQQIYEIVNILLDRKPTKNINFGLVYGMSDETLAGHLGLPLSEARQLFSAYHEGVPFVKSTYNAVMRAAGSRGWIKTLSGRRARFPRDERGRPLRTHKSLNSLLQGGSADVIKKAMVLMWEEGVFDDVGLPLLTVHDELDFDDWGQDFKRVVEIMEHVVELEVPLIVDCDIGDNWGLCG